MFRRSDRTVARAILIGASTVATLGTLAYADDLHPPPWERFQPYSTTQGWDFQTQADGTPNEDLYPGGDTNYFNEFKPNDVPFVEDDGDGGAFWDNGWYGPGYITFYCPNWIDTFDTKYVWIQITGAVLPGAAGAPNVSGILGTKGGENSTGEFLDGGAFDDNHWGEVWIIHPNPDYEFIGLYIPEGAFVSEVVIDTISLPAPGTVAALGLAGLSVARRRR